MKHVLPIAKPENYVPFEDRFRLHGKNFLALPGCVTTDPLAGASIYNFHLLQRHACKKASSLIRVKALFLKYPLNRRVIHVKTIIGRSEAFELKKLSRFEVLLLITYLK